MIIGTCGYGSSGSSVITDYLKEYDIFQVLDDIEFTLPYCPDGLQQLDFILNQAPVRNESSYVALWRFEHLVKDFLGKGSFVKQSSISRKRLCELCDEFLNDITQCRWNGFIGTEIYTCGWFYRFLGVSIMKQRIIPLFEKKTGKMWKHWYPYHELRMSIKPENFLDASKKLILNILNELGADAGKPIILDQPFPGDDPISCMKYFDDPIAFVVDRDPRDLFIFLQTRLKNRGSFMPYDNVEDYIDYYKAIRDKRQKGFNDSRVMFIQFEDMVYHYDETTKKVRSFLHLPENPHPMSIFNPKLSMANTQLFKRFHTFNKDVEQIEKRLSEYLFDYSNCPEPDKNVKMFFGKSPLNKKGNLLL